MVPLIATACSALIVAGLFGLNRDKIVRTSPALWIPVAWLLIAGSRNVSEWIQLGSPVNSADRYLEGSPVDRYVLTTLMAGGLLTLAHREPRVRQILARNGTIIAYFLYCGASVLWSDFPQVAGKRWFRSLGDVLMVLVILTDSEWVTAVKRVVTRVGFVLLSASVLFIRYYPDLGRSYGLDGSLYWTGVATGKNSLGMICLIFGLGVFWQFLTTYRQGGKRGRKRRLAALGIFVLLAVWLLWIADSKTSLSCFVMVASIMAVTSVSSTARKPAVLGLTVVSVVSACFAVLFLGIGGSALETMGRNGSLTGRTDVWALVIRYATHEWLGAGYESFWLGDRLKEIVSLNGGINQAHNGYIEVYLNLGWVGISLLALMIITGYTKTLRAFKSGSDIAVLLVAYFTVAIVYNFTEGSFKMMSPVWIAFLLVTMAAADGRPATKSFGGGRTLPIEATTVAGREL